MSAVPTRNTAVGHRRRTLVLVAVALVVGVVLVLTIRQNSDEFGTELKSIEEVTPGVLRVNFIRPTPCHGLKRVEVDESAEEVTLTVVLESPSGDEDCTQNEVPDSEVVTLESPLDDRPVIDGDCEGSTRRSCEDPTVDPL